MIMEQIAQNYSPIGDNMTLILCIVFLFLKSLTFSKKEIKLQVFKWSIDLMLYTSAIQLTSHILSNIGLINFTIKYYLLLLYFLCPTCVLMNYMRYIAESFEIEKEDMIILGKLIILPPAIAQIINFCIYPISIIFDLSITQSNLMDIAFIIFFCIYWYCIALLAYTLIKYRKCIMHKIWKAFIVTTCISVTVVLVSTLRLDISFLSFTFLLPLIAAYILLHNNPFNIKLGTLDANSFENYLLELGEGNKKFTLVCLKINCNDIDKCLKSIKVDYYLKYPKLFDKNYIFKLNDSKYVFILDEQLHDHNLINEYLQKLEETLNKCKEEYNATYKISIIKSSEALDKTKKYITFNKYLEKRNDENTIFVSHQEDLDNFFKFEYIKTQLKDIYDKKDLNDPRVLVYCQPVYDTLNERYESAEALMRLTLPDIGMVFPDQFIPIAEEYNYIHQLSLIILNKTCQAIKKFESENYILSRVSVNFSITELRSANFCSDIKKIIEDNNIETNKIAIELTESKIEQDFELIKEKVDFLKQMGILFYLDDFGTGYSNFERVLKLPIDIIKFDRSLVIMSNQDQNYKYMVKNFSETFNKIGYKILFEGIEDENDEKNCIGMNANYLQGYKYSRPIPINNLSEFLQQINKNKNISC